MKSEKLSKFLRKKYLIISLVFVLVVGTGGYFYSHIKEFRSPEKRAEWIVKKLTRELKLTESQQVKVNKIKNELLQKRKEHLNKRKAAINELSALFLSEKMDEYQVTSLVDKRLEHFQSVKPFLIKKFVEFHDILTPKQRDILVQKMKKLRKSNVLHNN